MRSQFFSNPIIENKLALGNCKNKINWIVSFSIK